MHHPSQGALYIKSLWALSLEAKISSDGCQLKQSTDVNAAVAVVGMSDLSQTKAVAGKGGGIFVTRMCM